MLEQLFGSKTRVMLLRLFLNNPDTFYFVREIARCLDTHLNSIRRELENLEQIGIIASCTKEDFEKEVEKEVRDNKKYYKLNRDFIFVKELQSLLNKAQLMSDQGIAKKVEKLGNIKFFLLSGVFVGRDDAPVDLLVVGTVNRVKLKSMIKGFEKDLGKAINYAVMDKNDFLYRYEITDKFLYDLLGGKNMIVVDTLLGKIKK